MSFRRAVLMKNQEVISSDVPLEYISSKQKNYIKTGYFPATGDLIECTLIYEAKPSATSDLCTTYFGCRVSASSTLCLFRIRSKEGHGLQMYRWSTSKAYNFTSVTSGSKYKIAFSDKAVLYDKSGRAVTTVSSSTYYTETCPNLEMYLFNCNQSNKAQFNYDFYIKICGFKVTRSGSTYLDLVPVLHNGEPCFYDNVSGGYFNFTKESPSVDILYG